MFKAFPLVTLVASLCFFKCNAQSPRDVRKEALQLKTIILKNHVQPPLIDDSFSQMVFDHILTDLDPHRIYFTQSDVSALAKYKKMLDDELNGNGWAFFNLLKITFKKSVDRSNAIVSKLPLTAKLKSPVLFVDDTLEFCKDEASLKTRMTLWLKDATLHRIAESAKKESQLTQDFFAKNETIVAEKVRQKFLDEGKKKVESPLVLEKNLALVYFNAIVLAFDPHTAYMSATDMEKLLSMLGTEGYYFGFTLAENVDGETIITAIVPGSPAWKAGDLNMNDVIQSIRIEGNETVNLDGMPLDEVNELLDEADHNMVELVVKKSEGVIKKVNIRREKITQGENVVRSFVLTNGKKIGYIALPDFYTRWGDATEGARCANDVAKEIIKLKKEKIEGLILDVRYNGGGSLLEAIAMAGIFIDEGSLGVMQDNAHKLMSVRDMNRGTAYDGPLVVMVNAESASASEFLGAALQDHHRALIVGAQTYGKATAQDFYPIKENAGKEISLAMLKDGFGYVKVTCEKIYRVNGKSLQGTGLKPDIEIPDILGTFIERENQMLNYIKPDSIVKKTYYTPLPDLPVVALRMKSKVRIQSNNLLQRVPEIESAFLKLRDESEQAHELSFTSFIDTQKKILSLRMMVAGIYADHVNKFQITNHHSDAILSNLDEYTTRMNDSWFNKIKSDLYLGEAFEIISDVIDLQKK